MGAPAKIRDIKARHKREMRAAIEAALDRHGWALRPAARDLGVRASTLQGMIESYDLGDLYASRNPGPGRPKNDKETA